MRPNAPTLRPYMNTDMCANIANCSRETVSSILFIVRPLPRESTNTNIGNVRNLLLPE